MSDDLRVSISQTPTTWESRRNFYLCLVAVAILSFLVAPFLGQHYDPNVIAYAGVQVVNGINPYLGGWWYSYAYPPFYLYYSGFIAVLLNDIPLIILPEYRIPPLHLLLIKLPFLLSHLAIAVTLYESRNPRFPRSLPFLYLISPFPFFISTIWGNMDELCALFILLSLISLYRDDWVTAGLMWGIACSLKVFVFLPTIIIPLLVIAVRQRTSLDKFLKFLFALLGVFLISSIPFLVWDAGAYVSSLLWRLSFVGWSHDLGLSYGATLSVILQAGVPFLAFLGLIPILIFLAFFSYLIIRILRSKNRFRDFDGLNMSVLAIVLIAYLSTIVVNEMNYVWAMPLLLLYWSPRVKNVARSFLILNVFLLVAVMIDWTPFDFIPGADPHIVINYQVQSSFRILALASLGLAISWMVITELRNIFRELEHKRRKSLD
jgi:Gpi18-like mannosyltransferase